MTEVGSKSAKDTVSVKFMKIKVDGFFQFAQDGGIIYMSPGGNVRDPRNHFIKNPCPLVDGSELHGDGRRKIAATKPTVFQCTTCHWNRMAMDKQGRMLLICSSQRMLRKEFAQHPDAIAELANVHEKWLVDEEKDF